MKMENTEQIAFDIEKEIEEINAFIKRNLK